MHTLSAKAVLFLLLSALFSVTRGEMQYPATKTVEIEDVYFGKTYKDPYRWLEDVANPDVESWFKEQSSLTERVLAKIPARRQLANEWLALDKLKAAEYSNISYQNGIAFYKKTAGGENVGKLYIRKGWAGDERLLFDPTTYGSQSNTVMQTFLPSWDGSYVVIGLTAQGAEYSELRILEVANARLLPEKIYPSWGPYGWMADNKSFLYDIGKVTDIKSIEIELNRKSRLHRIGTSVQEDIDFFSNESYPDMGIAPKEWAMTITEESYPDIVFAGLSTVQNEAKLFWKNANDAGNPKIPWKTLCELKDNIVRGFLAHGDHLYAITHTGAPKYKVVRTKLKSPDWAHAEIIVPEAQDSVQSIAKSRNYLLVTYSDGVVGRLVKYEFASGKSSDVELPARGMVSASCPDWKTDQCFVSISSWTQPRTRYDYDVSKDIFKKSIFNADVVYPGFDQLVADEVEVPSHDGTMVPLSVIYKRGIKLDGSNSCILEGYGAYGISLEPEFDIRRSLALRGVVLAIAHPRGGSEKGEQWYKAGYKTSKTNTWKDFIACGEYLVKKGFTNPSKLAGTGTSAGGILITRAITERPDLFRAAICNVGCANAMRLEFSANGPVNTPEFGTVKDRAECEALFEMDGMQHVLKGRSYPAVMGVAGWNDPRVAVWQPGKFIAAVQNASSSGNPALLKVNYDNGHFTEEKSVTFSNFADQAAFLLWQTGHKDFQPRE
jgi:prolyl oligopeptidase